MLLFLIDLVVSIYPPSASFSLDADLILKCRLVLMLGRWSQFC